MIKSQQRFQFTLKGIRRKANIEMTIHTLGLTVDSFSCNCNSIHYIVSIVLLRAMSFFRFYCCICILTTAFFMHLHFNFVQQCIQISTRINCSMYIRTSVCVSFETSTTRPMQFKKGLLNPIFNSKCPDGCHLVARALWVSCMFDACGSISDSRCGTLIGECKSEER